MDAFIEEMDDSCTPRFDGSKKKRDSSMHIEDLMLSDENIDEIQNEKGSAHHTTYQSHPARLITQVD